MQLIETMRVTETGEIPRRDRHLHRLSKSAGFFSFSCDLAAIETSLSQQHQPGRLRLLLSYDGTFDLKLEALEAYPAPRILRISPIGVNSNDIFLRHKTTNRVIYERARDGQAKETDVILVNERGEATETTIANIAVWHGSRWITPALQCGLLPGVMRAELLDRGEIAEAVVMADDLKEGEIVRCFNSVRGIFALPLQP